MRCLVPGAFLAMLVGVIMVRAENPLPIESANVLPEAISDDFEFRKFEIFRNATLCSRRDSDPDEGPDGRLRAETQALGSATGCGHCPPRQVNISHFSGEQKDPQTSPFAWNIGKLT